MNKHFYFPFYTKEFISATVGMRAEEVGGYIRLLCYQFDNGILPINNMEELEIIAGTKRLDKVIKKFPKGVNDKLSKVKTEGERISNVRREAVNIRYKPHTKDLQKDNKTSDSDSDSDSELYIKSDINTKTDTKERYRPPTATDTRFDEIWNAYPKRVKRKEAGKHFAASVKTDKDFDDIRRALKNYLKSKTVRDGFVQNGSTWFNNWRDYVDYKDPTPIGSAPPVYVPTEDGPPSPPPPEFANKLKNFKMREV